ncbi:protein Abitram [Condylostylus longicornis]|uniref:protein Abitram n=1 Tax=Condylostylus longicornis TaxID=2530218 RepID=UPI00244DAA9A|nr:protein Abitram [Condylostylus longicornis]
MSCDSGDEDSLNQFRFEEEEQIIGQEKVHSITNYYVENFPSSIDRFFTRYYYINTKNHRIATEKNLEVYSVLFHSNRVCLIGLADCHPALNNGIESITFEIGNCNRSLNKVSGKGKKGGMILQEDSTLAIIIDKKSNLYRIPSCIRGKLIEINERLLDLNNINILGKEGDGFIAIVLPKPEHCKKIKEDLLSKQSYEQYKRVNL